MNYCTHREETSWAPQTGACLSSLGASRSIWAQLGRCAFAPRRGERSNGQDRQGRPLMRSMKQLLRFEAGLSSALKCARVKLFAPSVGAVVFLGAAATTTPVPDATTVAARRAQASRSFIHLGADSLEACRREARNEPVRRVRARTRRMNALCSCATAAPSTPGAVQSNLSGRARQQSDDTMPEKRIGLASRGLRPCYRARPPARAHAHTHTARHLDTGRRQQRATLAHVPLLTGWKGLEVAYKQQYGTIWRRNNRLSGGGGKNQIGKAAAAKAAAKAKAAADNQFQLVKPIVRRLWEWRGI